MAQRIHLFSKRKVLRTLGFNSVINKCKKIAKIGKIGNIHLEEIGTQFEKPAREQKNFAKTSQKIFSCLKFLNFFKA